MPLTRDFKQTILERAQKSASFRRALLEEALSEFLAGNAAIARAVLRDIIHITSSFEEMASELNIHPKSLHRMLGDKGNPGMNTLAKLFLLLQQKEKINYQVRVKKAA